MRNKLTDESRTEKMRDERKDSADKKSGGRTASVNAVARQAGVSLGTVRNRTSNIEHRTFNIEHLLK